MCFAKLLSVLTFVLIISFRLKEGGTGRVETDTLKPKQRDIVMGRQRHRMWYIILLDLMEDPGAQENILLVAYHEEKTG